MEQVNLTSTREETMAIGKIADRAQSLRMLTGAYDRITLIMDLTATNANGCPMDFERLLAADDFNFAHDIAGIANTIDRSTGKLAGLFLPRFAKPRVDAAA